MKSLILIVLISTVLKAESGTSSFSNMKSKFKDNSRNPTNLNESFQKAFGAEDCKGVREKVKEYNGELKKFDTFSLALMGYCEEDFNRSERIFKVVDKMSPNDELIITLHARSLTNRKNNNAWELWNKLLQIAKSKVLLDLAKEMLQNHEWVEAPDYSNRTFFYSLGMDLGALYYSNPSSASVSSTYDGSPVGSFEVRPSLIKQWQNADFGINTIANISNYFSSHTNDTMGAAVEMPLQIYLGKDTSLRFRPFANYVWLAKNPFEYEFGGGIGLVFLKNNTRNYWELSFSKIKYPNVTYIAQEGVDAKLEFDHTYRNDSYSLSTVTSVDYHALGTETSTSASIPYSNIELTLQGLIQWDLGAVLPLLLGSVVAHQDTNRSVYSAGGFTSTSKFRQELQASAQMGLLYPVTKRGQIFTYIEYDRIFSTMGSSDYQDRNYSNVIAGVLFRLGLGDY